MCSFQSSVPSRCFLGFSLTDMASSFRNQAVCSVVSKPHNHIRCCTFYLISSMTRSSRFPQTKKKKTRWDECMTGWGEIGHVII